MVIVCITLGGMYIVTVLTDLEPAALGLTTLPHVSHHPHHTVTSLLLIPSY
jgi:hypothetical protein